MNLFASVLCRTDTTRVEFTIPLRENWALPFFAVQIAAITFLFKPHLRPSHEVRDVLVLVLKYKMLDKMGW